MTEEKETFGNFSLASALEFLNLFPYSKWDIPFEPVYPGEVLKTNLRRAERQVISDSNEWEQRLFMELIFLEALENRNIRMWQEKQIDAGESPFRGKADFVFTPYRASFGFPFAVLSQTKRDDFEKGWGQCLMAMKSASMINEKNGYVFDIYGIVSTGKVWEFGKYTADNRFCKTDAYKLISRCAEVFGYKKNTEFKENRSLYRVYTRKYTNTYLQQPILNSYWEFSAEYLQNVKNI